MAEFFGARTIDLAVGAEAGIVVDALLWHASDGWRAGAALAGMPEVAELSGAEWDTLSVIVPAGQVPEDLGQAAIEQAGMGPSAVHAPVLFDAGAGLWGVLSLAGGGLTVLSPASEALPSLTPPLTWAPGELAQTFGVPATLAAMAGPGRLGQGGMLALGLQDGRVLVVVPQPSGAIVVHAEIAAGVDAGLVGQAAGLTAMVSLTADTQTYLLVAVAGADRVLAYRMEAGGGAVLTGTLGAAEGVGLASPAALAAVPTAHGDFVVVAGQASSTLAVMELDGAGRLILRDQIMDDPELRLGGVSELRALSVDGRDLVLAGGADRGISLMALGPDGRLYHLASTGADPGAEFGSLGALDVRAEGDLLRILTASHGASQPSVTLLSADLSDLGVIAEDWAISAPTERDDILIATVVDRVLAGGAGADLFVFSPEAMAGPGIPAQVLDFQPGIDRLDLSAFPMLSNAGQVHVSPTPDGAELTFRGHSLILHRAGGGSIGADELWQADLFDAMHAPVLATDPASQSDHAARLAAALGVGADTPGRAGFFTFAGAGNAASPLPSWQDWSGNAPILPAPDDTALIASYFDLVL